MRLRGRASPDPAAAASPLLEDWGIALVLSLYPIVGLGLGAGDALTLFGVAVIVLVGARLPSTAALRAPILAAGVCVLLALLCLFLPSGVDDGPRHVVSGHAMEGTVRILLAGVVGSALLRGRRLETLRGPDRAAAVTGLLSLIVVIGLATSGAVEAARAFAGVVISLGLVYGVYRLHLDRSPTLPLLGRTGAVGALGAVLVVLIREGAA
jgi:hypothetical protein